jgi:hypothetical protein
VKLLLADPHNEPMFSSASLWEIAIKSGLGRDDFQVDARLLRRGLLENGYGELPVTSEHAVVSHSGAASASTGSRTRGRPQTLPPQYPSVRIRVISIVGATGLEFRACGGPWHSLPEFGTHPNRCVTQVGCSAGLAKPVPGLQYGQTAMTMGTAAPPPHD